MTATGLLLALPMNAAWTNKHGVRFLQPSDFPTTHQPLVTALHQAEIAIVDGYNIEGCEVNGNVYSFGYYLPAVNAMVICTNAPDVDIPKTLTHEAVHAVQDCRTGLHNEGLRAAVSFEMYASLPTDDAATIKELYPREKWVTEAEAFYFADNPEAVAGGVRRFCL